MIPYTHALHRFDVVRCSMVYLVSIPLFSYGVGIYVFGEVFSLIKVVLGILVILGLLVFLGVGYQPSKRHNIVTFFILCLMA